MAMGIDGFRGLVRVGCQIRQPKSMPHRCIDGTVSFSLFAQAHVLSRRNRMLVSCLTPNVLTEIPTWLHQQAQ